MVTSVKHELQKAVAISPSDMISPLRILSVAIVVEMNSGISMVHPFHSHGVDHTTI